MGKKKKAKKTQAKQSTPSRPTLYPKLDGLLTTRPPTPEELKARQGIVSRLSMAFKALSDPPERVIDLFDRIALSYTVIEADDTKGIEKHYLIKQSDLEVAEENNQKQGSIIARLYPAAAQPDSPDMPANTHNPATGEPLDEFEYDLGKVQG